MSKFTFWKLHLSINVLEKSQFLQLAVKPSLHGVWTVSCALFQEARPPDREASWGASGPCSWMGRRWTWRRGHRSPRGWNPAVRAIAAPTGVCATTEGAARRGPGGSPVTASSPLSQGPSAHRVSVSAGAAGREPAGLGSVNPEWNLFCAAVWWMCFSS